MSYAAYEAGKKNGGLAILLEFVFPGLGSVYSDHAIGGLITWTCMIAGIAMIVWGIEDWADDNRVDGMSGPSSVNTTQLTVGILLLAGGRIYGFVDAYRSADAFNERLRAKLGLPVGFSFNFGRVGGPQAMSFGPRVTFKF
jgi:hypothetical protein